METTATKDLAVGDSVYLKHDPGQEVGTVVSTTVNKAQWLVAWASGKTWIYHSTDLMLVES